MSIPAAIHKNDKVIAVMGPTGAGKSSFINAASGNPVLRVGHSLMSETREVFPVRCRHPDGRHFVLVDTPGFDDTFLSDTRILTIVADWLGAMYQKNIKLAGVLYLHRITDNKMAGTPRRNLTLFRDLCGDENMRNVVLVTTMWNRLDSEQEGFDRERELRSIFWKDMISLGSRTRRFQGTFESAWDVIDCLDLQESSRGFARQEDMVDPRSLLARPKKSFLINLLLRLSKVFCRH